MELTINNQEGLDADLSVKLTEADYKEEFEKSLKEHGHKMNVPGFRPGKIPLGVVKKMIGKDVKRELVEKFLQKSIQEYLESKNIKLVLSPLSTYHAEDIDWKADNFEFTYNIGMRPEIKLDLKPLNKLTKFSPEISDKDVEEDVMKMRRQVGKMNSIEEYKNTEDYHLTLKFTELDESGEPLEAGLEKTKRYDYGNLPKKLAELIVGKGPNFETIIKIADIFSVEEMVSNFSIDAAAAKDLFPDFKITVIAVTKIEIPEMNEDFFKMYFPDGEATTEEAFYAEWRKIMERYFESQGANILARDAKKKLLETTQLQMPEQFIKKYFLLSYEKEDASEIEDYDKNYEAFKEELKWLVLAEYISDEQHIEITEEDVIHYTEDMVQKEFNRNGYYDIEDKMLRQYAIDYLTKENNFNRTSMALRDGRVFDWLIKQIEPKTEKVSLAKFEELRNNQ